MQIKLLPLVVCATGLAFGASVSIAHAQQNHSANNPQATDALDAQAPPMLGIHWARGFEPNARAAQDAKAARPRSNPDMINHGGVIMPSVNAQPIFWGTSWAGYKGDKITGMDSWYTGFSNSHYAGTSDEYTGTNGQVGPVVNASSHVTDTSASTGGSNTSVILAEVCKVITNPDSSGNGYYPVYTDTPRGHASYCAWHSYGTCSGVRVQFAFFFNLDGDAGCDPQDNSGLHSQGLAALANVSGHELSEARTDPASPGAWYDSSGQENGDKCAWTFGVPLVTFSNGTEWKIQGEWSNNAYDSNTGYPNRSGQDGCLSGY